MANIGDNVRMTMHYAVPNASAVQNVFHWTLADANIGNTNLLADLLDWAENTWGDAWKALASSTVEIDSIDVSVVLDNGSLVYNVGSGVVGLAGAGGSDTGAAAVSAYMSVPTSHVGSRASKYVPGIDDTKVTDGALTTAAVTSLGALLDVYLDDIALTGGATLQPGVVSRVGEFFYPFLSEGTYTDIPAYQRRRKPNVGS